MKVKRLKRSKRTSLFYVNNFGFREPVRVLVDGTFCQAALTTKMYLQDQVPAYLGIRAQLVTTKCCVEEIAAMGEDFRGAKLVARRFDQRKCRCRGLGGGAEACLLALIGDTNPEHYVIATQDAGLKEKLKHIPGVPILSINFGQLVQAKPSDASLEKAAEMNRSKSGAPQRIVKPSVAAAATIEPPASKKAAAADAPATSRPKRKRKKEPNPLCCKKKKSKSGKQSDGKGESK
eukprot:m.418178 g.418178  ORF g.418178 m.418178 type:complete len:234 (-) comp30790_c0_seq1:250-951(-)